MRETSGSVHIRRPADEVFRYLRVYDNQAAWEDYVLEARSEPPGPAVVGTRVHKVRRTPTGPQETFTLEIVAMDEAARRWVDVALDGDLADTRVEWSLHPVDDGCRLDVRVQLHAHGLFKRLMPVLWRTARRQLRIALGSLKLVLEAGPPAAAPPA
ncbi:MAG: SRPBCC family protein [Kofleriaceae bacterium]